MSSLLRAAALAAISGLALALPVASADASTGALCSLGPLPCSVAHTVDTSEKSAMILLNGLRPFACQDPAHVLVSACGFVWSAGAFDFVTTLP